jgi:hypothetical protein
MTYKQQIDACKRDIIVRALAENANNISRTALLLELHRNTLILWMDQLGLPRSGRGHGARGGHGRFDVREPLKKNSIGVEDAWRKP